MLQKLFNPEWQITSKFFLLLSFLIGFSFSLTAEISRLELEKVCRGKPRKFSKRGLDRSQMEQPIKKTKFSYFARSRLRLRPQEIWERDYGFLWIAGSAILVLLQTQNIADGKISAFESKAFTQQNYPDSKVFGLEVPTLNSRLNISGDISKPGCFHFGFVVFCVNGKTNPVL